MSEPDWDSLPPLREIIARHNLRAEKKLGQNFLLDLNITDKIARAAGDLSDATVFEIGPGPGGLTRSLLKAGAKKVIAVEYDPRAVEALRELEEFSGGRLQIVQGDALETDLLQLAPGGKRVIAANLPYNIATLLLVNWLRQVREDREAYSAMMLMFQREVAERLTAKPNSKAYGRLSILAQWLCDAGAQFSLPPQAFTPPPKVTSSVVRFVPKTLPADAPSFEAVGCVTAAAFGQRRKMLRSSLKDYREALARLGIDETLRAENLAPAQFIALAAENS